DTSANEPPTIDSFSPIEAEITIDLAVDPLVDFSITASDPENDPLTYLWTIDGQLVSITTSLDGDDYAAHATLGDHTVVVSVNDGNNPPVLHSWILHITDSSANQPPTIDSFTPTETEINIDLAVDPLVDFAITASDPENDPLTYEWTFGGQTVSTTANLDDTDYAALATVGDHTVLVSVTDGNNPPVTHSWTLHITDTSANQPPTIDSFSPIETTVNLDVGDSQEFSVTASDPENDPLTYSWTVDGTPVGTNSNSYTYNATTTGQFIIRITVTDSITLNPPYQEWTVNVQSPDMLEDILKKTFGFFWYETDNPSTGLIRDRLLANVPDPSVDSQYNKASMAATGFGLAAMCVAAEKYGDGTNSDWQITPAELAARVEMILDTLLGIQANQAQAGDATWGIDGFFYHFVNIETGERWVNSEVSSIDTAILVAGALTAGEYFESINANIKTKAEQVYANINWASFIDNTPGAHKGQFYKQWMPGGVGYNNGHWDYNDESLLLYLLAIGSPNTQYAIDPDCYYSVRRELGSYATDGKAIVKTWFGSLFAYQYPHAFFDLRDMHDARNLDLWQNSTDATIANRQFCLDEGAASGYNQHVWGISSAYEAGAQYTGELGAPPLASPGGVVHTGTINPSVVGCAISMLPQEAGDTLLSLKSDPNLWYGDKYGFVGSFKNSTPPVYADYFVGIDLGSMLAMIANYNESGLIWNSFMDAATRYGTMRDLLTTLNFRPNADPKFYVDTDDISAKSQFAYGLIDSTNPTYQISFGLTSVTPNTEYLLALQIFMNNFVGNYDVTVNVNVNGTDQGNQTCSHIENTEDRIKYIDIDSVDLQTGENIITLTWQSGASWLAWKNAELSTPVLTNEWTIVTTELGNEYRVDNTYYAGHADSSLHGTDAYNTFERALNRVTDPYTEISFYMDDLSHDRIITLESLFADGTVYVDLIVNEQLAADNVTMNSSQQVTIPAGLLESGWNVIKLQIDSQGGEWIVWNTIDLALGNPVSLEPPEELAAAAFGADTVNLRWESVNGTAIRYNLYRSESQGGPYTKVNASPITSTQYQDTGRDDYTTYFYVVTAFEDSDPSEESDYSDEVEVATGNYELDYRDGREPNAFGGTASTHFSFVEMTRYDFTLGFAREVTLNAAETSWIGLNGVNLSQATHLSMWIKGTGTEEIEIGLEDGSSQQSFVGVTATSGWHNLHIKLDDFSGVSFNNMAKLYIRSNDTSAITLHIDDIVFERQDGSGFTLEVIPRFVSNNSRATGMSFDNNPGNEYAPANQYIEVKYGVDAENWKIWIYTNNTNGDPQYLGDQFNGLMTADGRHRVPLLWRVYPDVQAGGVPCRNHSDIYSGSNLTWNYVKDKNDGDWDSANQTGQEYSVTCYGSYTWAHLAAVPPGLGERDPVDSTYRVYLGGVFKNASAGEYSASIYFDLTHE
ncbi:MAG: hypothetical protein ISS92_01205, partial [Candidatus Omnitrophica bacterium]|nr:hypothetical protein [Candidatus Omnitrophota bacterium]